MKRLLLLVIFALSFVATASAVDVGIESGDDAFQLVVTSDYPITVSAYVVQLNYDPGIKVFQVDVVDTFTIAAANINDEEGFVRIAAASVTSAGPGQRIVLAKIVAQPGFSPEVVVEELYDDDLQPIPVAGQLATPVPTTPPLPVYTPAGIVAPAPSPAATVPPEVDVPWAPPTPIEVTGTAPPVTVTVTIPATGSPTVTATMPPPATGEAVVTGETPTQSASPPASTQTTPLSSIPVLGGMLIAIFIAVKRR